MINHRYIDMRVYIHPYLERQCSVKGFKRCYSTIHLGEEATCLAALASDSRRLLVLNGKSGQFFYNCFYQRVTGLDFKK